MGELKLKSTEHSYYCSDSNYYVNGYQNFGRADYDTWKNFKDEWMYSDGTIDDDNGRFIGYTIEKKRRIIYVEREPKSIIIGNKHDNPELLEEE